MAAFEDIPLGMVAKAADLESTDEACAVETGSAADVLSDSERALVYVFRLVRQAARGETMSSIDRAFIEGAKVTLGMLSSQCGELLSAQEGANAPLASATERPRPARASAPTSRKKREK